MMINLQKKVVPVVAEEVPIQIFQQNMAVD